ELAGQILGSLLLVLVLGRAVLDVAVARVQERRVRRGDGDDVGAHVAGHALDVARHGRRIVYRHGTRVLVALRGAVHDGGQEVPAVGVVVRGGDAGEGVFGDRVMVPVEQRLAQLAALVLRVRQLVRVDVYDGPDDADGPAKVRHERERHAPGAWPWGLAVRRRLAAFVEHHTH